MEVGQRAGAVAAGKWGGNYGQIGYQVGDAVADRFIMLGGQRISGLGSGV